MQPETTHALDLSLQSMDNALTVLNDRRLSELLRIVPQIVLLVLKRLDLADRLL